MAVALLFWLCAAVVGLAAYLIVKTYYRSCAFFDRLGVPFVRPKLVFGNVFSVLFHRKPIAEMIQQHYELFENHRWYGMFELSQPILMIRDLQLVKRILVRDFDHFTDHRRWLSERDPLLAKSLFMLRGDRWRDMRTTMTPAFTGSKMRAMFPFVQQCSAQYARVLSEAARSPALGGRPYEAEMKDVCNRFATDVIGTTAFGIRCNSMTDRGNRFFGLGYECVEFNSCINQLKVALMTEVPRLFTALGLKLFSDEKTTFYHDLVHGTMRKREQSGERRPDMIHLLMEAKRGFLRHEEEEESARQAAAAAADGFIESTMEAEAGNEDMCGFQKRFWDDDDITAQCFLFFFNGCETMSTLLSFAVQELMENWEVQKRLLAEVDEACERMEGGAITYDELVRCKYLDMVVSETLRKWPPITMIDRVCTKEYRIEHDDGTATTLPVGTNIWVPVYGIQRDARYFPDPDRFDPERFSEERKHSIETGTLLALGMGPRNCIGSRFVMMEVKAFLFDLLRTFTLEIGAKSRVPLQMTGKGWLMAAKNGVNVHLRLRR